MHFDDNVREQECAIDGAGQQLEPSPEKTRDSLPLRIP